MAVDCKLMCCNSIVLCKVENIRYMKKVYAFLVVVLLFVMSGNIDAQTCAEIVTNQWYGYDVAGDVVGDFDDSGTWCYNVPTDGNLNQPLLLYGEVSRTGDISVTAAGTINGVLNVSGSFTTSQRMTVNGELNVGGDYDKTGGGADIISAGATLTVEGTFSTDYGLDIYDGATVIVDGDFICNSSDINIYDGGILEVKGSLTATGLNFTLHEGATLIVHQNYTVTSGVPTFSGDMVVVGSFVSNNNTVTVTSTGNLVVGEDLIANNNFNVDGDNTDNVYVINGTVSGVSYSDIVQNGAGDIDDFNNNESGNTALTDIVSAVGVVPEPKIYYTLASGDWNDEDIWTLDPSGSISVDKAVPAAGDHVVILTGKTVTVPDGNDPYDGDPKPAADLSLELGSVTIYGNLDLRKSSGHTFEALKGNGRLLMAGDNYPTVTDDSKFVDVGEDEGTVVYYGSSNFNIQSASTFYNLEIDMDGSRVTLREDYQINGNLLVKGGTARLGEGSSTRYTMTVLGDITINSGAELTTRTGDSFGDDENDYHHIVCSGNFINNGTVDLTTQSDPVYNTRLTGDGVSAVVLTMTGTSDVNLTCNGTTNLYRLIIDKGSDQTYTVNLSASSEENFILFGCNNQAGADTKALYLKNGTLKLSGNIFMPTLTEGGSDFAIPATAQLWLNGSGVAINSTARSDAETQVGSVTGSGVNTNNSGSQSFTIYGKLRVTEGAFNTKSHGIVVWNTGNAVVQVEGGAINTAGLRSAGSSTGIYSYIQSGGTVTMYGEINTDGIEGTSGTFSIKGSDNAFIMTGGILEIQDANGVSGTDLAIEIESAEGNYNVTGGTVRLNRVTGGGANFYINSTAPFYNLELVADVSGTNVVMEDQLTILNDVTIPANTSLNAASNTLEIGGHFTNNGTYTTGTNTTKFIGENASTVNGGTITFSALELDKESAAQTVTLGTGTISISDNLTISKGTLDVGTTNRNVGGDIDILYGDIYGSETITLNGSSEQQLNASATYNSTFGDIIVSNSASTGNNVLLTSNVRLESLELAGTRCVFNIDRYKLSVGSNGVTSTNAFGTSNMIMTNGEADDRGLELDLDLSSGTTTGTIATYPIGSAGTYTPAYVILNSALSSTYSGSLRVTPVDDYHPALMNTWYSSEQYWKTKLTGNLSDISSANISLQFYDPYGTYGGNGWQTRREFYMGTEDWLNDGKASSQTITFGVGFIESDFTVTISSNLRWVDIVYSRQSGDWNDLNTWSLTGHDGNRAGFIPWPNDIVIIGGTEDENHTVTISNNYTTISKIKLYSGYEGVSGEPTLDIGTTTGHSFTEVTGGGRFRMSYNGDVPNGVWDEFMSNDTAVFEYYGGSYTLPSELAEYPTLHLNGSGTKTGGNTDLLIYQDILADAGTFNLSSNVNGDIVVMGDVNIDAGTVQLPNSRTRSIEINGDINFTGAGSFNVATGGSSREHQIDLYGNIYQNSGTYRFCRNSKRSIKFCR